MKHCLPWLLVLAACHSVDPAAERTTLERELGTRLGHPVALPISDDLDPGLPAGLAELLTAELTPEAAVKIALANHRGLRALYERLGIARADFVQAGLLRNPTLDADPPFVFRGTGEVEFGLVLPLLDLFHRPLRERMAAQEVEQTLAEVAREVIHTVYEVRRCFLDLQIAQQLVDLQNRHLAAAAASHELMQVLHRAGNATDQQLAAARLGEATARLDLAAAERTAMEAREPLQSLLGLWGPDTSWRAAVQLAEDAPDPDLPTDCEAAAVQASLELAANRAAMNALAQQQQLAEWRGMLASLDLGLAAQREPGDGWNLGPKLVMELPLFDRGQASTARAAAQLRQRLHLHLQIATDVRAAARFHAHRLAQLQQRLQFWRETSLPARADLVFRTEQHYQAMQTGAFTVLHARQQQLADYCEYLQDLRRARRAALDLRELLAGSRPNLTLAPDWPDNATRRGEQP
jgi:cobalt-zinc-cadmium efflux system outer membrane protein